MTHASPALTAAPPELTEEALEQHFRQMLPSATVLAPGDLPTGIPVGCVDGRRRECVAGAPGGHAGLLIVLLTAWEQESGQELTGEGVARVFHDYLDHFGAFYLHTDRAAQDRLAAALDIPPDAMDQRLRRPPADLRPRLLHALGEPAHMGCGHLGLMMEEPEAYQVRPELVRAVVRAFFARLWDGDHRLVLDVLDGTHLEDGVVRIRAASDAPAAGGARGGVGHDRPTLVTACPHHGALELLVYHPAAVEWLQSLQAMFLARQGMVPPDRVPECIRGQRALGQRQLEATLLRLAPGLPIFDVTIETARGAGPSARVAVRLHGHVPPYTRNTQLHV
jgi:hypothetical protein